MPDRVHPAAATPSEFDERVKSAHDRLDDGEWLFSWGYHCCVPVNSAVSDLTAWLATAPAQSGNGRYMSGI